MPPTTIGIFPASYISLKNPNIYPYSVFKDKYIELVRWLKLIYQIVLYAVHLIDCNLRRAYIHVFVYLHGIRGYYSTIYFFCKFY